MAECGHFKGKIQTLDRMWAVWRQNTETERMWSVLNTDDWQNVGSLRANYRHLAECGQFEGEIQKMGECDRFKCKIQTIWKISTK